MTWVAALKMFWNESETDEQCVKKLLWLKNENKENHETYA